MEDSQPSQPQGQVRPLRTASALPGLPRSRLRPYRRLPGGGSPVLEVKQGDILELSEDVVLHAIPELDKFWAFRVEAGDQYELNETAYFLLSQFREPLNIGAAIAAFAARFDKDMGSCENDCIPLLGQYLEEGLFQRR